jgi:cadmium resistance protein CadD (predicted permease)
VLPKQVARSLGAEQRHTGTDKRSVERLALDPDHFRERRRLASELAMMRRARPGNWSEAVTRQDVEVSTLFATAVTAAGAFAATNIDDFVVLTALFATIGRGGPSGRRIVVGQYLGIATLLAGSAFIAVALLSVPERWVGLLGLVPVALGVRGLLVASRSLDREPDRPLAVPVRTVVGVAGVTIANGADNISVYTPLLHKGLGVGGIAIFVVVFAFLVAVWCWVARHISERRAVIALVEATGHWLVPAVFIVIGVIIVATSGLLGS